MIAMLAGEPWCWTQREIEQADPWFLFNFVFWPRDKNEQTIDVQQQKEPPKLITAEERFKIRLRKAGIAERHIESAWAEERVKHE